MGRIQRAVSWALQALLRRVEHEPTSPDATRRHFKDVVAPIAFCAGLALALTGLAVISINVSRETPALAHASHEVETADDRTATWTEVLAWLTAVLAGGAVLQLFFLVRADRTARLAADAAKSSADAAVLAQRPWVQISNKLPNDIVIYFPAEGKNGKFRADFRFENIGATPALNFVARCRHYKLNEDGAAQNAVAELLNEPYHVSETIYPKGDSTIQGYLEVPDECFNPENIRLLGVLVVCWYRVLGIADPRISAMAFKLAIRLVEKNNEMVPFRQADGTGLGVYLSHPLQPIDPT